MDLIAARPVDLQIVDGIKSLSGGEGPWAPGIAPVQPGLLVAGTNPVATDAVCMKLMGLNPMVDRGTHPFETSENMSRLAEEAGLGTRDLNRIEVVGSRIKDAVFDYAAHRKANPLRAGSVRSARGSGPGCRTPPRALHEATRPGVDSAAS